MGRRQKLKQQRREEEQQELMKKKERRKKIIKIIAVALIVLISAYGINSAFSGKSGKNANKGNAEENGKIAGASEENKDVPKENIFAMIETDKGNIKLELFIKDAPKTVENFVKLANEKFYDGIKFHRVMSDFMIQGGDPISKGVHGKDFIYEGDENPNNLPMAGTGGPGYSFEDEINPWSLGLDENTIEISESRGYKYTKDLNSHKVDVESLAMANSGPNTNGSQFFIVTMTPQPHLDGLHTVFGKVVEGIDVVRMIERGDMMNKVYVVE